jgi:predicted AlkP superfamily phosphohydrolase/phosphomutase
LQHYFYDDEPTKKAWKIVDRYIGLLKDKFQYVIIHSDHGTSPMIKQFFINAWFEKEGYLFRKKSFGDILIKLGFNKMFYIIEKLNIINFILKFNIFKSFARLIPDKQGLFGETEGSAIFQKVNWKKSKVVGSAQGPIYINNSILTENEKNKLKDEIISKLESFKDPETDKKPIEKVYRKEEIYTGIFTKKAPDLIALDSNEYHNKGGIGIDVLFRKSSWRGNNSRNGLFLLYGSDIKKGKKMDIDIYDLAPTILHIFNVPIPFDMDGNVLKDAFKGDLHRRKINFDYDKTQFEKILIKDIIKKRGI